LLCDIHCFMTSIALWHPLLCDIHCSMTAIAHPLPSVTRKLNLQTSFDKNGSWICRHGKLSDGPASRAVQPSTVWWEKDILRQLQCQMGTHIRIPGLTFGYSNLINTGNPLGSHPSNTQEEDPSGSASPWAAFKST
jgi:hypothetical protein